MDIKINRDKEILEHIPYTQRIATNICAHRNIKNPMIYDDCRSVAVEALIKAVDNYDNSKKASIKTFATIKVRYALMNHFRKESGYSSKNTPKNTILKQNLSNPENIDSFENSLSYSINGTEKKVCNKDLVYKIFQFTDTIKSKNDLSEILQLHFIEGYNMKEVGEIKGVTESRISQIIAKTLHKTKKAFRNEIYYSRRI